MVDWNKDEFGIGLLKGDEEFTDDLHVDLVGFLRLGCFREFDARGEKEPLVGVGEIVLLVGWNRSRS